MLTDENSFETTRAVSEEYFENDPTGIEIEKTGEDPEAGVDPWDPDQIRVSTKHYSIRQVIDMIADNDIDLTPDFQRKFVWKKKQRSGLIESLLLGIPLPSFYFNEDNEGKLQVVDGVQRLNTIFNFMSYQNERLRFMTYLDDLKGLCFDELPPVFRRRLKNSQIVAHVIDPQTPYRVKFDIFRRINTGGTPLSAQEIRHCMSGKTSRRFLTELASEPAFVEATGGVLVEHPRMADREVILRFIAFRMFALDDYAKHDGFDEFLSEVSIELDRRDDGIHEKLRADFNCGMINCRQVFGEYAFRKWPADIETKNPINRGLFESWGTVLADYDSTSVLRAAEVIRTRARKMMADDAEFINSISSSTGTVRNVQTRFERVRGLVREALQ